MRETSWNFITDDTMAYFSSSEQRWITKIRKLAEQNPEEVTILKQPQENGGVIYAQVPPKWLKVSPPRKVNYTEEQRSAMAERLRRSRQEKA